MPNHFDHILDNLIHVRKLLTLNGAESRKVQQSFSDPFASECFILDPTQIRAQRLDVGSRNRRFIGIWLQNRMQYSMQPGFESLSAPSDRSQRIVDFMCNTSRQKSNAGKLFIANDLLGSLSDLLLELFLNR
jgi:hypothetical protein